MEEDHKQSLERPSRMGKLRQKTFATQQPSKKGKTNNEPMRSPSASSRCFKYGDYRHKSVDCKFDSSVCYRCKKPGNLKRDCTITLPTTTTRPNHKTVKLHHLDHAEISDQPDLMAGVFTIIVNLFTYYLILVQPFPL